MKYTDKQIKECLTNITYSKYHKYINKITIMNSRLELFNIKFLVYIKFNIEYIKSVLRGTYCGICMHKNSNIYLFAFNNEDEDSCILDVLCNSLHEIRHAYVKENNKTFYGKYANISPCLNNYFNHPLENDAQNFAVTIMNKNMSKINSEMGIEFDWEFNYV